MPLDPEIAAHLDRQKGQPLRSALDVAATREMMRRAAAFSGSPPSLARVEDAFICGAIPVRHYWPQPDATLPLVVYFHGGRFFSGDLDSHDTVCRLLSLGGRCRVMAVDYRLAPEHPFPAAAVDASLAVEWALTQSRNVAVAGDSAGANLAAVAAQRHRGASLSCQVLIYPMIDATCATPSYREFASGYGPGAADMERGWKLYLPEGADPRDPRASPLFAPDLSGLPPALVLTAEYDTLRDEGEAYTRKLAEAGTPVISGRYPGAIHGFFTMPGILRIARDALSDTAAFLRRAFATRA